ncbi:MAG: recombinase family protein [Chloroflexota bacterium]|nr:recombinase family protein [Chloroflexota bacterium]
MAFLTTTKGNRHSQFTFEELRDLRARGYVRDSTLDQRDGFGPDIQRRNIQRFAESYGLALGTRWYIEFVSGRSARKRPEFQQFLQDAELDAYDVLLVDHTSRFGRNQEECIRYKGELKRLGKIVVFVSQGIISGSDRDFLAERINETLDEQYSRNLSRYVRAGLAEKATRGLVNGVPPLGYGSEKLQSGKREKKIPDPKTMPALLELLRCYASDHYSYRTLADHLNSAGHRTRMGRPFTEGSVQDVLRNRFYEGKAIYHPGEPDEEVREGVHQVPLEVKELWLKCQVIKRHRRTAAAGRPRKDQRAYPFARVAECAVCHARYGSRAARTDSGDEVRRLVHNQGFCHLRPHSVSVEHLKAQFRDGVLPYVVLDSGWQTAIAQTLREPEASNGRGGQRAKLERALDNLRKQHLWGDIADEEYRAQHQALERELGTVEVRMQPIRLPNLERAAQLLNDLPGLWSHPGVTDQQREALVEELLVRATISGSELEAIEPKPVYQPLFAYALTRAVRNPMLNPLRRHRRHREHIHHAGRQWRQRRSGVGDGCHQCRRRRRHHGGHRRRQGLHGYHGLLDLSHQRP